MILSYVSRIVNLMISGIEFCEPNLLIDKDIFLDELVFLKRCKDFMYCLAWS